MKRLLLGVAGMLAVSAASASGAVLGPAADRETAVRLDRAESADGPLWRLRPVDEIGVRGWLTFYVRMARPAPPREIEIDFADRQYGAKEGDYWSFVWRPPSAGRHAWRVLPHRREGARYRVRVDALPDVFEFALKPSWRYRDYAELWRELARYRHFHQPRSAIASDLDPFAIADVTELAATPRGVGPILIRGGLVTDRAAPGPKRNVVLVFGQHPGEDQAVYFAEQLLWVLLRPAADVNFESIRRAALSSMAFHVYYTNPIGGQAGSERGTAERDGSEDQNRSWNGRASSQAAVIKRAIALDTGGRVDVAFDIHGSARQNTTSEVIGFFSDVGQPTAAFLAQLRRRVDWHDKGPIVRRQPERTFHHWVRNRHDAVIAATLEIAEGGPGYPDAAAQYRGYAEALLTTLVEADANRLIDERVSVAERVRRRTLAAPPFARTAGAGLAVVTIGLAALGATVGVVRLGKPHGGRLAAAVARDAATAPSEPK